LTGNFKGQTSFVGGFSGNPLLLTNNLEDEGPKIRLDATSSGTTARWSFEMRSELQLFDDLEFTGNGTQNFIVYGDIVDYYEPRSVTKTGTSVLTLSGNNTFRGELHVNEGQIKLTGPAAEIQGASRIVIGSAGSFSMDSGLVEVAEIDRSAGGAFQFTGGELRVTEFAGSLHNQGGNYSPGASAALSTISGNFVQTSGKLTVELGGTAPGTEFDQLAVGGAASLGGTLQINLVDDFYPADGDSFDFLIANGGISGAFSNTIFPDLGAPWSWQLVIGPSIARLVADLAPNPLPGDYNYDGVVNAADYVVWRKAADATGNPAADGNGDGTVNQLDYALWRANFGKTAPPSGGGALARVPEPSTLALVLVTLLSVTAIRRCR